MKNKTTSRKWIAKRFCLDCGELFPTNKKYKKICDDCIKKRFELKNKKLKIISENKKKYKTPEEIMGDIPVLSTMNISPKIKKQLQKEAGRWKKYIQLHSEDMHENDGIDNLYHKGEISFIEFFFFFKSKKKLKGEIKNDKRNL